MIKLTRQEIVCIIIKEFMYERQKKKQKLNGHTLNDSWVNSLDECWKAALETLKQGSLQRHSSKKMTVTEYLMFLNMLTYLTCGREIWGMASYKQVENKQIRPWAWKSSWSVLTLLRCDWCLCRKNNTESCFIQTWWLDDTE